MKTVALGLLKKLIDKYGTFALSYILTKLFSFLFNKYGSTERVVKEIAEITRALNYVVEAAKDGKITEVEIKKAIPLIEAAVKFKK